MMDEIRTNLGEADELIAEADNRLRDVARAIEDIVEENSTIRARGDIVDESIRVSVNHRKTVEKLNRELPYPFYAKEEQGGITVVRLEVPVDEIEEGRPISNVKEIVEQIDDVCEKGAPEKAVINHSAEIGFDESTVRNELEKLKQKGEVYEPSTGRVRPT